MILLPIPENRPTRSEPTVNTIPAIATAIPAAIRPYSIAVAPFLQRIKASFFAQSCKECGIEIPSDHANQAKVLAGHSRFCEAMIEGKRLREEAGINEEELQMMMDDDDGGDGSWREEQFATSEHDEGNEATSNRDYDSENGDLIEEENEDGSRQDSGRSR